MFSLSNSIVLLARISVIFLLYTIFSAAVFAQSASNAQASSDNDFSIWYIALTIIGLGFCASLLWWRYDKQKKAEAASQNASHVVANQKQSRDRLTDDKNLGSSTPKIISSKSFDSTDDDSALLSVQNDSSGKQLTQEKAVFEKQAANVVAVAAHSANGNGVAKKSAALTFSTLNFEVPTQQLQPLVPLPTSENPKLLQTIAELQRFEASEEERSEAIDELSRYKTINSFEALAKTALDDESPFIRVQALNALGEFNHESTFETVLRASADDAREVRSAAARVMSGLSFDRIEAFSRLVESNNRDRLQMAAAACVDAGLVNHAFNRLIYADQKQADETFAIVRLLVAAENFAPIIETISNHDDLSVRLTMIEMLKILQPEKALPALYELSADDNLDAEVRSELNDLIADLSKD